MASTILGKVSIISKGLYSHLAVYEILNIVNYEGSSYLAKKTTNAGILPTNEEYFVLVARKGQNPEFQKTDTHVQWKIDGGDWIDLIALVDLYGERLLGGIGTPGSPSGSEKIGDYYEALTTGTYANFPGISAVETAAGCKIKKTVAGTWYAELENANQFDIFNVTNKVPLSSGYYTIATAVLAVPSAVRKGGLTILFDRGGNDFIHYKFKLTTFNTNQWNDVLNWEKQSKGILSGVGFETEKTIDQKSIIYELMKVYSRSGKFDGDYYFLNGYVLYSSGCFSVNSTFKCTGFIKLNQSDTLQAANTLGNSTSYNDINFFDSNFNFISGLSFTTNQRPFTVNSANIPANTAYCLLNALSSSSGNWVKINGEDNLTTKTESLKNSLTYFQLQDRYITGNFFNIGFYANITGGLTAVAAFKCTDYIDLVQTDEIQVFGTYGNNTSVFNVTFYDSLKARISGLYFTSNQSVSVILNSSNIPANTAFVRFNALTDNLNTWFIKNGVKDLKQISLRSVLNYWYLKKWCSFGDSITALTDWQNFVKLILNTKNYVRGVGSSAMTTSFPNVAVRPDGTYINRRSLYATDIDFQNALAAQGFTNQVTNPTWHEYALSPSSYTLPIGSYFLITSQASSQDRVDTIPKDSQVVSIMFMTNDMAATVGTIDDYANGTFYGEYRILLDRIKTRVPDAKIILCIAPKGVPEYNSSTHLRTSEGILKDNLREAIYQLGKIYGYNVIDFSKGINFNNLDKLSDDYHPNINGQKIMSEIFALQADRINTYY